MLELFIKSLLLRLSKVVQSSAKSLICSESISCGHVIHFLLESVDYQHVGINEPLHTVVETVLCSTVQLVTRFTIKTRL